eukprot:2816184-Alexandrium_andersonii.AAC.1
MMAVAMAAGTGKGDFRTCKPPRPKNPHEGCEQCPGPDWDHFEDPHQENSKQTDSYFFLEQL